MIVNHDTVAQSYLSTEQENALRQATLAKQAEAILAMGDVLSGLQIDGHATDEIMTQFSRRVSELDRTASKEVAGGILSLRAALGITAVESSQTVIISQASDHTLSPEPVRNTVEFSTVSEVHQNGHTNGHKADQESGQQAESPVEEAVSYQETTPREPTPEASGHIITQVQTEADTNTPATEPETESTSMGSEAVPAAEDEAEVSKEIAKEPAENVYDKLCKLLRYTTKSQQQTLVKIFSMNITQPVYTEEAQDIYSDLVFILDLTINDKKRLWPVNKEDDLELLALNTVLRGANDEKSPLAPESAKGKLGKELATAKRKFEEVLESALTNFAAAREEILGR